MWQQVLVLAILFGIVSSTSIINTLPGFSGDLPFKLETGYVGVGDLDDVQLFYYFIESEGNPEYDPLVLWLTGGPGCSGFSALVYENIGPLSFDSTNSIGNKPQLMLNPYSWTKVANIIFLDAPVGTGYSYAKSWEGYNNMSDTLSAAQIYEFLRKWLMDHPKFIENALYVAGDSYSGIIVPIVVQKISDGNEAGHHPPMNIQGYVLGNPATDLDVDDNYKVPFAFRKALISDELYQSYIYRLSYIWANDKTVQDALHVREGSIKDWQRCNKTLSASYISDVSSSLVYHQNLIKKGYRVLIYSGDHDMLIPYLGTVAWIESLNLTVDSCWKPWFVNGQIAGYRVQYIYI